ncbi:MAG: glycosyltransferase family 4 protein [Clostridia bacterium]|nr:glycosyltransferase family 4 protein [Clostridium sp.]
MKILMVNKFHYLKGGSEKYYFELAELLKKNGHEIAFFSMDNERNIKTDNKEYFVKKIDLNSGSKLEAIDVIYSKKNKVIMKKALKEFRPDIVHINNFQRQLSESIVEAIYEENIPIVFTAHDVQAICPAITMLDNNKEICELCKNGKYINCIKKNCIKNSKLKSVLGAIEGKYYRIKKVYSKKISYIITPSEFYRQKLIDDGIDKEKIETIYNSIDLQKYDLKAEDEGYALYFGRLSKEKGILNLIEAFSKIQNKKLYIAGDGPEKNKIIEIIENNNLQKNIKLLGYLNQEEIKEYIRKCSFVVVPSIWYENCPYSILETLAIGKPVIGADIGGIPELVKNKENGLIFKYDDVSDLENKMKILFEDNDLVKKLGDNAKKSAKELYGKDEYYKKIIKIYENIIKQRSIENG